jgi:hypothetical protein
MILALVLAGILIGAMEFGVKRFERALGFVIVMALIGFTGYPRLG